MKNEIIEAAIEALQPINYDTHSVGYFVKVNDEDMGGEDYCENCIGEALDEYRRNYKKERAKIKRQFKSISEKGYYMQNSKKIEVTGYTKEQLKAEENRRLEEYPSNAVFTYEGHDTDFSGGSHEHLTCEGCGEIFSCDFTPDEEQVKWMEDFQNDISERSKWILEVGLRNYKYVEDELKPRMIKVAEKIIIFYKKTG